MNINIRFGVLMSRGETINVLTKLLKTTNRFKNHRSGAVKKRKYNRFLRLLIPNDKIYHKITLSGKAFINH